MAFVKFINGKNEKIAGMIRAIDYITNENKTEIFTLEGLGKKEITQEDKEAIFIERLIEDNKGKRAISYITKDGKTHEHLITGINCNAETAFDEMVITKKMYRKETGRQFIHFTHSYHDKENITPELAHEISLKLIDQDRFKGFQILVATHVDKAHLHTHFILNTVNLETGMKWQQSNKERDELIRYSNKLCAEYNLKFSFIDLDKEKCKSKSTGEYRADKNNRSWKTEAFYAIKECRNISKSKEEFIENLNLLGYKVRWVDSRKNITFTLPNGRKINNDKFHPKKDFTKEALLKRFELNKQFAEKKQTFQENKQIEEVKNLVLEATKKLSDNPELGDKNYPLTYLKRLKGLEGQALKEKMIEKAKGEGLDWEKER